MLVLLCLNCIACDKATFVDEYVNIKHEWTEEHRNNEDRFRYDFY